MLDSVCPLCQTVLLREPNGQDYCVACKELGSALGNNNSPINIKSSIEEQGESLDRDSSEDAIGDNNIDANGKIFYHALLNSLLINYSVSIR